MPRYIITESQTKLWHKHFQPVNKETQRMRQLIEWNESSRMPLEEIDWQNQFPDVQHTCQPIEDVIEKLNSDISKRQSISQNIPVIPKPFRKRLSGGSEQYAVDIDKFIREITKPPSDIWGQNAKTAKSSDGQNIFLNMGLPAAAGIIYDIDEKQFHYVITCTGAGECKKWCYAMNGSYIMYEAAILRSTRILNYLLNYPDLFLKKLEMETAEVCMQNREKNIYLRWHDAGDFFAASYIRMAKQITDYLSDMGFKVKSYAYTKVADAYRYLNSDNFIVGFSEDANEMEREKFSPEEFEGMKRAITVPTDVTRGAFIYDTITGANGKPKKSLHPKKNPDGTFALADPSGAQLKNLIANYYGIDSGTLLLNNELPKIKPTEGKIWNVIIPPHENDHSAIRKDVRRSYLLFH